MMFYPNVNLEKLKKIGVIGGGQFDQPVIHQGREEPWPEDDDRKKNPSETDDQASDEGVHPLVVVCRQLKMFNF